MAAEWPAADERRIFAARTEMLRLIRAHVHDDRIVDAFASVDREAFVPAHLRAHAYDDRALPIGEGQTISQPLMVALMLDALAPQSHERVLEIGTGSGYVAALLSRLARDVVSVERRASLAASARARLASLGMSNVAVHDAGDQLGWPQGAPYDAILVSAAAPHVPRILVAQLTDAGRIVLPVGSLREQELVRATRTPHGLELARLGPCAFVPLIGAGAWGAER